MSHRQIVTDHLLLRWLERVEGYDLSTARSAMERTEFDSGNERETLDFIETYFGFDVEALRRELRSIVYPGLRIGAKAVNHRGFLIAFKNGVAVTVLAKGNRRYRR